VEGATPDEPLVRRALNSQWLRRFRSDAGAEGPSLPGGNSRWSLAAVPDQSSKKQLLEGAFFLIHTTQETESAVLL